MFCQPDIYKNILLRNVSPLDPEYDLSDLINDSFDMFNPNTKFVDQGETMDFVLSALCENDDDATLSKEQKFRQAIHDTYIKPRSVALTAMKEGIQLYGTSFRHYYNACKFCQSKTTFFGFHELPVQKKVCTTL